MLETKIKGLAEDTVREDNTAIAAGSGGLPVYATPFMTALMEKAACTSVAPYLEGGQGTVGVRLDITHESATPVGMRVRAESELIEIQGKKLIFRVEAQDERGLIGRGTHERFIIDNEKFLARTALKLK